MYYLFERWQMGPVRGAEGQQPTAPRSVPPRQSPQGLAPGSSRGSRPLCAGRGGGGCDSQWVVSLACHDRDGKVGAEGMSTAMRRRQGGGGRVDYRIPKADVQRFSSLCPDDSTPSTDHCNLGSGENKGGGVKYLIVDSLCFFRRRHRDITQGREIFKGGGRNI